MIYNLNYFSSSAFVLFHTKNQCFCFRFAHTFIEHFCKPMKHNHNHIVFGGQMKHNLYGKYQLASTILIGWNQKIKNYSNSVSHTESIIIYMLNSHFFSHRLNDTISKNTRHGFGISYLIQNGIFWSLICFFGWVEVLSTTLSWFSGTLALVSSDVFVLFRPYSSFVFGKTLLYSMKNKYENKILLIICAKFLITHTKSDCVSVIVE